MDFLTFRIVKSLLILLFLHQSPRSYALQPGNRVSTLSQTLHNNLKTQWLDLPAHQMPRFLSNDNHIFHTSIPKQSTNDSDYIINPNADLKISFTFLGNKLTIPWITMYDSKERVSLKKLTITFTHDEFEIITLHYKSTYGGKIQRVDPTHPALRGFELEYTWESVQEDDFGLGVIVMFISAVVSIFVMICLVLSNSDIMGASIPSSIKTKQNKGSVSSRSGNRR